MSGASPSASPAAPAARASAVSRKPDDFKFGKELGVGSFSEVCVAREIASGEEYAIKVVDKVHVTRNKAIESVHMEKEVLKRTNHAFIVRLYYAFQDASRLYFVLSYAKRGELLGFLNQLTSFNVECTRFYMAEIFSALGYLHSISIVHRDLKPENVLLSEDMHIKLCDFGSAIIIDAPHVRPPGFTGTAQYVSPEMLNFGGGANSGTDEEESKKAARSNGDSKSTDLLYLMDFWAFGCILYQFLSGRPPFRLSHSGSHEYEIFQKILNLNYSFPEAFDPDAKDLVQQLLVLQAQDRLGSPANGGHEALRKHAFFSAIADWDALASQSPPTLVPNLPPVTEESWAEIPVGYSEGQKYQLAMEIMRITDDDREELLTQQRLCNPFHRFTRGRLILKQVILYKRRGLFARKRMFLLTEGPHLFYVDPDAFTLKGEVPFSARLTVESKSHKIFYVHTPGRTYYLEDPTGRSQEWMDKIAEVRSNYFAEEAKSSGSSTS